MKQPKSAVAVALPTIPTNSLNFNFTTTISGKGYKFNFMWCPTPGATTTPLGYWRGWCTFPNKTVRPFGCNPNATNWYGFSDVGLLFLTSLANIGQNDWSKVTMTFLSWV